MSRSMGVGRGKVFPARYAHSLLHPLRRLVQAPHRTVARMALAPTDRVLEIGSGPGYFSDSLADAVPRGSVVLFDVQSDMLQLARARLRHRSNVDFVQGDACRLPFGHDAFLAVLIVLVLGEVPDQEGCLAEVRRVLRHGGSVTFAESWRDSDFIPFRSLKPRVERHGFRLVDKRGFPWEYSARFQRA